MFEPGLELECFRAENIQVLRGRSFSKIKHSLVRYVDFRQNSLLTFCVSILLQNCLIQSSNDSMLTKAIINKVYYQRLLLACLSFSLTGATPKSLRSCVSNFGSTEKF